MCHGGRDRQDDHAGARGDERGDHNTDHGGRGSDLRIEADETDVFWFRNGTIVRVQGFPTNAEALEAAQVSLQDSSAG